jgi:acetolactate synthase I/II/III large subunit
MFAPQKDAGSRNPMTAHEVPEAAANLVALLADEGVSHLFINPGTDSAPLQEGRCAVVDVRLPQP